MAIVMAWPDRATRRRAAWGLLVRRVAVSSRLWARRRARRRFVNRVLAETNDPRILADLGIHPDRTPHVERWMTAMLWHQH
jgi:hypothetical protein